MNSEEVWSSALTLRAMLKEMFKGEVLPPLMFSVPTGDVKFMEYFRRNFDKIPVNATIRVSQDKAMGLFFGYRSMIFRDMSADILKVDEWKCDSIPGEEHDKWPEFISRFLVSFSVDMGQPLDLSQDGQRLTATNGWRIIKRDRAYTLAKINPQDKTRVLGITISGINPTTFAEDFMAPYIAISEN